MNVNVFSEEFCFIGGTGDWTQALMPSSVPPEPHPRSYLVFLWFIASDGCSFFLYVSWAYFVRFMPALFSANAHSSVFSVSNSTVHCWLTDCILALYSSLATITPERSLCAFFGTFCMGSHSICEYILLPLGAQCFLWPMVMWVGYFSMSWSRSYQGGGSVRKNDPSLWGWREFWCELMR
jgi:hypothetical protein